MTEEAIEECAAALAVVRGLPERFGSGPIWCPSAAGERFQVAEGKGEHEWTVWISVAAAADWYLTSRWEPIAVARHPAKVGPRGQRQLAGG